MSEIKEERVTDLSIIMEMIDSKPYYSVQYRNVGEDGYNIGYSSYNLKTVLEFIGEYFEIVESDSQTNADRIRNMSDEEMAERIASSPNFNCADYCDSFTQTCAFNCNKKGREIALKWLQSEVKVVESEEKQ